MRKIHRISQKTGHIFLRILEVIVAFIGVILLLALYELHRAPMDGQFLLPEIEKHILPSQKDYHLQADSVVISSDWQKPGLIQIEMKNMKLLRSDHSEIVSLPVTLLSYDFWHIITLNYMPTSVVLKQPQIDMIVAEKNIIIQSTELPAVKPWDLEMMRHIFRYIISFRRIDIQQADIQIQDIKNQRNLHLKSANLSFHRWLKLHEKIHFDGRVHAHNIDTQLMFEADLNRLTKQLTFETGIPSVRLSALGYLVPFLKGIDFATQISLKGDINIARNFDSIDDVIQKINFQIKSLDSGTLNLPAPLENVYPIQELIINGVITQGGRRIKIDSSHLHLKTGVSASLSADVTGIDEFLKTGDLQTVKTTFKSTVLDIPTEKIPSVWPRGLGTSTHDWVATHLSQGRIPQADFTLYFTGDELSDLYGDVRVEGVRVDYLPPMAVVEGLSGHVYLHPTTVQIKTSQGHVGDLQLKQGDLLFTDVDIEPTWANIKLDLEGPVQQALELIASKPLEFPQMFGILPEKSGGHARIHTDLFFKLDTDISPDEVKVNTTADITDGKIQIQSPDILIEKARLKLQVSNDQMDVQGRADVMGIPLNLKWQENFKPQNNVQTHYELSGVFDVKEIGEKLYPDISKWATGQLDLFVDLDLLKETNDLNGKVHIDAQNTQIHLYPFSYTKPLKQGMKMMLQLNHISSRQGDIVFDLMGPETSGSGEFLWGKETQLKMHNLHIGPSSLSLDMLQKLSDLKVSVSGELWDMHEFNQIPAMDFAGASSDMTSLSMDVNLQKLILNPQKPIMNLQAQLKKQKNLWQKMDVSMDLGHPMKLSYNIQENQLSAHYPDFGELLSYLNQEIFDKGSMNLSAEQTDDGELQGTLMIQNTELKDTGFLTQALTIFGILDAIMGNNLFFDSIEIPFVLTTKNHLQIEDASAQGTNLGITFSGDVSVDKLDVKGSIIPAYALNSLPGRIPLVGWFFRSGSGGGLVHLPYSISGTLFRPHITYHPSGIMTPGILGQIF